jgi:hypothetical protein
VPFAMSTQEESRVSFHPQSVRTLFVGESPPANGSFFYLGDSNLARYTREALGELDRAAGTMEQFLREFQGAGFFLRDLCVEPVNQLPRLERRAARRASESVLASRLRNDGPAAIVVVMKAIVPNVRRAIGAAGLDSPVYVLPFPAQGHQREYVSALAALYPQLPRDRADS